MLNPPSKDLWLYYRKFQYPNLMLFRSYIGPYLPSGERLHVVEINVQSWRCACLLYSVAPNTMAKPVTKTPRGWEQCHMNGYLPCLIAQGLSNRLHRSVSRSVGRSVGDGDRYLNGRCTPGWGQHDWCSRQFLCKRRFLWFAILLPYIIYCGHGRLEGELLLA